MAFSDAVARGQQAAANPFGVILSRVREVEARKIKQTETERKEVQELKSAMLELGKKHEFDLELQKQEQKGKVELEETKQTAKTGQLEQFLTQFGMGGQDLPLGTKASIPGPGGTKLTVPLARKFTGEEVKSLSTAEQLTDEIGDIKELIKGPKGTKAQLFGALPFGLGTEEGQNFKLLKSSIGERLLRLRSGAQINEKEFQRFMKLLPAVTRIDKLDIEQLERFEKEFTSIRGRILSGAKFDKKSGEFTTGQPSAGGQGNVVIMTDAQGNKARVRVDANGNPTEVLEEL